MTKLTTIVWREWYNDVAVKQLTEMGTLPCYETDIDISYMDGDDVAAEIAEKQNSQDGECFLEGGEIVILEPEQFAGTYEVSVEYEPRFTAYKTDSLK